MNKTTISLIFFFFSLSPFLAFSAEIPHWLQPVLPRIAVYHNDPNLSSLFVSNNLRDSKLVLCDSSHEEVEIVFHPPTLQSLSDLHNSDFVDNQDDAHYVLKSVKSDDSIALAVEQKKDAKFRIQIREIFKIDASPVTNLVQVVTFSKLDQTEEDSQFGFLTYIFERDSSQSWNLKWIYYPGADLWTAYTEKSRPLVHFSRDHRGFPGKQSLLSRDDIPQLGSLQTLSFFPDRFVVLKEKPSDRIRWYDIPVKFPSNLFTTLEECFGGRLEHDFVLSLHSVLGFKPVLFMVR